MKGETVMLDNKSGGGSADGGGSVKDKFDAWLSEVMLLRATFVESGAQFFHKVSEGEELEIWKLRGYTSFEKVLEQCNIMKVSRYKDFKMLCGRVGWDVIEKLGVDELMPLLGVPENAVIKVGSKEEIAKVAGDVGLKKDAIRSSMTVTEAVVKTALESRARRGAPPSRQSIQAYVTKFKSIAILPRSPGARPARKADERDAKISALKKDVADRDKKIVELKRAVAERDRKIKDLEKRLDLLRARKR